MRITIVGKGYVGSAIANRAREHFGDEAVRVLGRGEMGLLPSCVAESDLLINAAGWCGSRNTDDCERERVECYRDNLHLPHYLAQMVRTHNPECAFHHISTGCFFSGDCEHPEDAAPNNLRGTYLHTKWHSEAVAKIAPKQAIWRIRLPFDGRLSEPRNLLAKLRRFTVLSDGRESTTYLPDLADAILLHGHLAVGGLWHATNPEPQTLHYMGLCLGRDIPVGETGLARSHTTLSTEALRSALGDHYPFRTTREALWAAFCC